MMEQLHQRQGSQSIKEATDDRLTEDRVARTVDMDSLAVSRSDTETETRDKRI